MQLTWVFAVRGLITSRSAISALAHAFFYGALLRETSPYTILLGLSVIAVVVGQAVGVWLFRRRYSRRTAASAPAAVGGR
jgi:hypothetical protein